MRELQTVTVVVAITIIIIIIILSFIPQVVKIPGVKNQKKLKSKCRMARGSAGQLAECRAKAWSYYYFLPQVL